MGITESSPLSPACYGGRWVCRTKSSRVPRANRNREEQPGKEGDGFLITSCAFHFASRLTVRRSDRARGLNLLRSTDDLAGALL
jgi:hypothetical protein